MTTAVDATLAATPDASPDASPRLHPAAEWAQETTFDATQVDCTTTVVLKILDNKCKMLPGEKAAIMAIYDVVKPQVKLKVKLNGKQQAGKLFDSEALRTIEAARFAPNNTPSEEVLQTIHELRVYAEAQIPKPVMKRYKAMLRDGLFG